MAINEKNKIYALDLSNEEWIEWLKEELGQPKFRAGQVTQWLWQKHVYDVDEMTDLSKDLREALKERVDFALPELMSEQRSKDGTRKFLWRFADGQTVESVLLKWGERHTACISTQVGCPLQCVFCATGLSGYVRNLSAGEIASQFLAMETLLGHEINNAVYMGMGEPFMNTENVLKSIRLLNDPKMRSLGIRHITVSTSGVVPGIMALIQSGLGVRLVISLHAVDDELRGELMPVNQRYPLEELRKAMEAYQEITGDRVSIEYTLFGGVNDSLDDARALVRYLRGIHVFINLIPYNAVDGRFDKPTAEAVLKFRKVLDTAGFESALREEQGADIDAACGQLRRKTASGAPVRLDAKPYEIPKCEAKAPAQKTASVRARRPKSETPQREGSEKPRGKKTYDPRTEKRGAGERKFSDNPQRGPAKKRELNDEKPTAARPKNSPAKKLTFDDTKPPAKRWKTDKPEQETYRGGRKKDERPAYKSAPDGEKSTAPKRRKTDRPAQESYRSGKKKEERPTYRGRSEEDATAPVQKKEAWFEGALNKRKKVKKTTTPKGRLSKDAKREKTRKKK